MGILSAAWNPSLRADVTWSPLDDRWYSSELGLQTDSSLLLSGESILRCGTVLAAVRFRGDSWAMCPPSTYRVEGRRTILDSEHYSHRVLRNPNTWMTGNRWRHLNGVWMATWGNAYNEIMAGPGSWADQLQPRHPSRVRVVDQRADGTLVYQWAPQKGTEPRLIGQERMLHFRDISTDGVSGIEMYQLIRNAVSVALAAERHLSTFLKKGSRIAGLVQAPAGADAPKRDELKAELRAALGGPDNAGVVAVVPNGITVSPMAFNNRDSQLLELSDAQVGAILRFLGVPGVVVGWQGDKTSTYASAEAFFEKGGIKHCVLPILTNVEAEEEKSLLVAGDGRQIKHNLDALLRANWMDRMTGLTKATGGPIMAVNEAREIEDMPPIDDPRFDRPHVPSNMAGADSAADQPPEPPTPPARPPMRPVPANQGDEQARVRGRQFALDAAARIVRREMAALRDRTSLAARDPEAWRTWLTTYYERHAAHVAEVLHIDEAEARLYATNQRDAVLGQGLSVCETWEETVPYRLAAVAYGEE